MATKHIISPGIGFSPGSVKFIVTRGFAISQAAAVVDTWTLPVRGVAWTLDVDRDITWEVSADRDIAWTVKDKPR